MRLQHLQADVARRPVVVIGQHQRAARRPGVELRAIEQVQLALEAPRQVGAEQRRVGGGDARARVEDRS